MAGTRKVDPKALVVLATPQGRGGGGSAAGPEALRRLHVADDELGGAPDPVDQSITPADVSRPENGMGQPPPPSDATRRLQETSPAGSGASSPTGVQRGGSGGGGRQL